MSEEEIMSTDLYTIYALVDVHAKMNGVKSSHKGNNKKEKENREVYIDTLIF